MYIHIYVYIYIYIYKYIRPEHGQSPYLDSGHRRVWPKQNLNVIHDRNLYSTTNKCLQCLIKIMYTVF